MNRIKESVQLYMALLLVLTACLCGTLAAPSGQGSETQHVDFLMPSVQPKSADTYLCKPMKMTKDAKYLVGFEPHADMNVAHHILLYGCTSPGSTEPVWNCGEMASHGSGYHAGPVCASGSRILYAWAMDAPSLTLPEDVGFKVGGNSGVDYLVLQVHYKDVTSFLPPANGHDMSGITMSVTDKPQKRRAGVYLMGTSGKIDPHTVTFMETACDYTLPFDVHPFAFRTHAHTLGKVTSGYRIRNGEWSEIGRETPQKPQMFYNSTTPGLKIHAGDVLAARCTMENNLNRVVNIGSTQNDEMCNFYMMYYTDGDKTMPSSYCFSQGPPNYYWNTDYKMRNGLANMPSTVSLVPGETTPMKQTAEPLLYPDEEVDSEDSLDDIYNAKGANMDIEDKLDEIYNVKGANMNIELEDLQPYELDKLYQYFRERGPRAYEEENGYY